MASNLSLDGAMVPRAIRRQFDQRSEPRDDAALEQATVVLGGREHCVRLVNLSPSGAMVIFSLIPNIGEPISLMLSGRGRVSGTVCWVKDGKVGITFSAPKE